MLSPKGPRITLLPEEQRMIAMLGMSQAEYRWFCRETEKMMRIEPGKPVAFDLTFFAVTLVVGIALNYAATLLAPRQQRQGDPARLEPRQVDGQDIVNASRFTARSSFTGLQNVVELNSPIPIVYSNREQLDGVWYGGVRVNTNLIWSQLWSVGGSQLFRGIFLVSESAPAIDVFQTAMGDNLFGSYDLKPADSSNDYGRVSFYYSADGGAITNGDYAAGRWWANDTGNSSPGGGEVFMVENVFTGAKERRFSYAFKPQTQTQFGVYGLIGAGLGYRINPRFSPAVTPSFQQISDTSTDMRVVCAYDTQRIAERNQQGVVYNGRTTLAGDPGVSPGDTLTLTISSSSDFGSSHLVPAPLDPTIGGPGEVKHDAAAQAIAGRQRSYDDALIEGELYKIGEALAVCTNRTDQKFISQAEGGAGQTVTGTFKVVESGAVRPWTELEDFPATPTGDDGSGLNGTQASNIFRCAISTFVVDRPARQIEIGFRSTLGITYNGMVNWSDVKPYQEAVPDGTPDDNIDWIACFQYSGQTITSGQVFAPQQYNSGTYTGVDERYSFFTIYYREASSGQSWTQIGRTFGTRSSTGEPSYNYLTLGMPSEARWEFRIAPITGFQIRNNHGIDELVILDSKLSNNHRYAEPSGLWIKFNGEDNKARTTDTFMLRPTQADNVGLYRRDDEDTYKGYVDAWGKVAEAFWYEEIQSSVGGTPEHEVVYVNVIPENPPSGPPTWDNMALLGMNLRAATESNDLGQISVYCTNGVVPGQANGHLFPNVLEDLLLNQRYGAGGVVSAELVDSASFANAAAWTLKQRYFFDQGLSQPGNLVSDNNELAQYFLLDLGRSGGRFTLDPIARFADDGAYAPEAMFTVGNVIESTINSKEQQERTPPIVIVKWRYEDWVQSDNLNGAGIFPVIRSIMVREASTPADAPVINADLSNFCTSEYQALDYAKMVCRRARLQPYGITFKTYPDQAAASPGAIIKFDSEVIVYSQPQNGVILNDGSVIATNNVLEDGVYSVAIWEGTGAAVRRAELQIVEGKATGYQNAVFSIAQANPFQQMFKVQSVDFDEDGNVDIQALFFPLDENGFSELTKNWEDPGSWLIDGVGAFPARPEPEPVFSFVTITGPTAGERQMEYSFTAVPFGPSSATYTYSWSTTNGVLGSPSASTTTLSADVTGPVTLTVLVTENGTGTQHSDTHIITLSEAQLIGAIVRGAPKPATDQTYLYIVDVDGPSYSSYTYSWSTTVGTLIEPTGASTVSIDFTGVSSGTTGLVRCDVTQPVNSVTVGATLSLEVVLTVTLWINGPGSVGLGTSQYEAILEGADPNTTTWSWEEVV